MTRKQAVPDSAPMNLKPEDTKVPSLGKAKVDTPLSEIRFIADSSRVLLHNKTEEITCEAKDLPSLEEAGPRSKIFFDPVKTKCAVVTCGGLCPGINDVIQAIVNAAHYDYNMAAVFGIKYGLEGFIPRYGHDIMELTPKNVTNIHEFGGTILGSSRGPQPTDEIVDALERMNINILFTIGGDGTMKATARIYEEITKRKLKIAVIGIPKTIDNDINFVTKSFGFDTAVDKATQAISCAHSEATGHPNGIGMVKLMGRESGFIAAQAALALKEVNFVLIPEVDFELEGDGGFLPALERRLADGGHSVIVVAEGAGQHLLERSADTDASGNIRLGDICSFLQGEIKRYLKGKGIDFTLKFIDPSYIIRSVPANSNDRIYCGFLGQDAVHTAMAGKTGAVITKRSGSYVVVPLDLVTSGRKRIDTSSNFWRSVLESTGQYRHFKCR